jgi:peptidoglycan/xylan/chitin deacetylase (PgdA/CDA1 family)
MVRGFPWARLLFAGVIAGTCGALVAIAVGRDVPWWALGLLAGGFVVALGAGIFLHASGLFARPIIAADPAVSGARLALTFDDGPDPTHTREVLALLEARGHRGTFFVIGRRAREHAELCAEIVRRGHGLANHSFTHSHATPFWPAPRLAEDLERAQALLVAAGARARWFRPPIGILSPRVVAAAARARLELVGWTASARDGVASATVERAAARLERALRPGAILVLHDAAERGGRAPICAAVLARVLDALDTRGLRSVTLDELLEARHERAS